MLVPKLKTAAAVMLVGLACTADSMTLDCAAAPRPASAPEGLLVVLPGVGNTRFHLRGFVARAERQLPGFEIVVRPWGVPLMSLHNLRASERNRRVASDIAAEMTAWRRRHPDAPIYLLGYSGGGGVAALSVAALPEDVTIERLLLVAPAISPDYPVAARLLPHVDEFIVNYASRRDLQVGWGTRTFGTIDRVAADSAGAIGFAARDPRLLQWHWSPRDRASGHWGNHVAYLGRRWQQGHLMPALDPRASAPEVRRHWSATCE